MHRNALDLYNRLKPVFGEIYISRIETPVQIYYRVRIKAQDRNHARNIAGRLQSLQAVGMNAAVDPVGSSSTGKKADEDMGYESGTHQPEGDAHSPAPCAPAGGLSRRRHDFRHADGETGHDFRRIVYLQLVLPGKAARHSRRKGEGGEEHDLQPAPRGLRWDPGRGPC